MNNGDMIKHKKKLKVLAMVNLAIWVIAVVALLVVFQGGGNLKGMYVILAGGIAVGLQLIGSISKVK